MQHVIEARNLTKDYRTERGIRFLVGRGGILDMMRGRKSDVIRALDDVTFTVASGESLGIIGANGSGKSTLLKILAGVTAPSSGEVRVYGRVASLLELGAGFHPMLTGRENVYLNAGLLGLRHRDVDRVFDEIVRFSGIGRFIEYPVDTYSSGMYVRLAFSIAVHANPDIFLIDEVLSVGDEQFQNQCRRRLGELREEGKTLVFVSHDLGVVGSLCERVILLSNGKMIMRSTPQKTTQFYLRQVGADEGLHTLLAGPLEAIVSNGRVSVFHRETEVTAAGGFQLQILSLGKWRHSVDADWTIEQRSDTQCVAKGTFDTFPATLVWETRIEDKRLFWTVSLECAEPFTADAIEFNLYFPTEYLRWRYEDMSAAFQVIGPEDTQWSNMFMPELLADSTALLPEPDSDRPALRIQFDASRPHHRAFWMNTDYMTGARVLRIEERREAGGIAFEAGRHRILSASVAFTDDAQTQPAAPDTSASRYAVTVGDTVARFERGRIRIAHAGHELTTGLHFYQSILAGNLWNDSSTLRWESFERDDDRLRFVGVSRRLPYSMEWILSADADSIAVEIWIQPTESLEIQEYQTSILLGAGYTDWESPHETGAFPEANPQRSDWQHLNHDYAPGTWIQATGEHVPTVRMEIVSGPAPRMTALQTDAHFGARVLQALVTPDAQPLHFDAGRHLLFSGRIAVAPGKA